MFRKDISIIAILFSLAILIWGIVFVTIFNGLSLPDSFQYASIARNIHEHKGLTSNFLDLKETQYIKVNIKDNTFPIIRDLPLYPLFISGLFDIFGVSEEAVGLSTGIFFILTVPFLYLLVKSLFGSTVAIISCLIYIFDAKLLFTCSSSGLSEPMFMFFLVILFYILYKSKNYKHFLLAGLVLGFASLTRPDPIFYLLPIAGYLFLSSKEDRIRNIASFLFGFTLVMTPYFVWNYIQFGNPFIYFCLRGYEMLPISHYSSLNMLSGNLPALISAIVGSSLAVFKKTCLNLLGYYYNFFKMANPCILAFFLVSIFRVYENKKLRNFSILFLVMFAVQIVVSSTAVPPPKSFGQFRHVLIFFPLIIMFASSLIVSMFENLRQSNKFQKYALACLLFLLISIPTTNRFYDAFHSNIKTKPHIFREVGAMVKSNTNSDDIVATNIPYELAWYSQRRTIGLPIRTQQLASIDRKFQMKTMLISDLMDDTLKYINNPKLSQEWRAFLNGFPESFLGFELMKRMKQDGKIISALYKKQEETTK